MLHLHHLGPPDGHRPESEYRAMLRGTVLAGPQISSNPRGAATAQSGFQEHGCACAVSVAKCVLRTVSEDRWQRAKAWQRTGRYTMIGVVNDPRVDRVPSPPGTSRKRVSLDCSAKPNVVRGCRRCCT
jgi:hypothetical protein